MPDAPGLSLIVPAYNEVERIASTLEVTQRYLDKQFPDTYELIVCADGTDGTRERAAETARGDPRVVVMGSGRRGGKGRAVREGVARARGRLVGFMDADYKTPIEELARLLPWLERGFDLVIGSRAVEGARIDVRQPLYRRIGSQGFGVYLHLLLGLWDIVDTQCGFKVFRGPVARDLFARQRIDGYVFDVEILYLAKRSGYRIKQVGVIWRDDRDSRLDLVMGNVQNAVDILRIRVGRYPRPAPATRDAEERAWDSPG